jgi:hypothetical protein
MGLAGIRPWVPSSAPKKKKVLNECITESALQSGREEKT